ncbi:hypothetical protein CIB84_006410 [Bambusicola thoracicus]|uniref:Uncharacterized protein n=1 Tax=Bambusicola thoracicus TaxID=9083 RepID=A0A2P4T0H1_BAMTH|nr:hypothetical protein CIB84_006410 [Bambusicola thoracicus]
MLVLLLSNQTRDLQLSDMECLGDTACCLSRAQTSSGRERPDFPLSRQVTIGGFIDPRKQSLRFIRDMPVMNAASGSGEAAVNRSPNAGSDRCAEGAAPSCFAHHTAQLSPQGGLLAGSCQKFLAITSRCPSVQLLKTADGAVGCSCARPVALQTWFAISCAYASSSIYTQCSQYLV